MTKEQIIQLITKAFADVKLGNGISLEQVKIMDESSIGDPIKKVPSVDSERHWSEIPSEILRKYWALSYLDNEGFRYYIPAFMIQELKDFKQDEPYVRSGIIFQLYPNKKHQWDFSINRYSLLTPKMKQATYYFLQFFAENLPWGTEDKTNAERAIRNYWGEFAQSIN